jgi:hypothetical protein
VSKSSAKAECRGVANAVDESCWLWQLLTELGHPPWCATVVFCDNVSTSCMSSNPVLHQRTKHIEIDMHFVRDKVVRSKSCMCHLLISMQIYSQKAFPQCCSKTSKAA